MVDPVIQIECYRIVGESKVLKKERIAAESQLELLVNGIFETAFTYSAGLEEQLVIGYLLSKGIIKRFDEISTIELANSKCMVTLKDNTRRVIERTTAINKVEFSKLKEIHQHLLRNQQNHRATRCFHGAVIYDLMNGKWFSCEDIGRQNAVDKVLGYCAQNGYVFPNCVLLVTGRLTSLIVVKGCAVGIPVIVSKTVATYNGIEVAKESNTTLIGTLSENECWLYHEGKMKIEIADA